MKLIQANVNQVKVITLAVAASIFLGVGILEVITYRALNSGGLLTGAVGFLFGTFEIKWGFSFTLFSVFLSSCSILLLLYYKNEELGRARSGKRKVLARLGLITLTLLSCLYVALVFYAISRVLAAIQLLTQLTTQW